MKNLIKFIRFFKPENSVVSMIKLINYLVLHCRPGFKDFLHGPANSVQSVLTAKLGQLNGTGRRKKLVNMKETLWSIGFDLI
jgi:hypothetical protein